MKPCPFCESEISETAKKCRHCGEWLDRARSAEPVAPADAGDSFIPALGEGRSSSSRWPLPRDAGDSFIPALGEGTALTGRYRLERRIGKGGMAVSAHAVVDTAASQARAATRRPTAAARTSPGGDATLYAPARSATPVASG